MEGLPSRQAAAAAEEEGAFSRKPSRDLVPGVYQRITALALLLGVR